MADKKISEFPTFDGEQGPKTYYIISSGDPGEANSANYRMPFTNLVDDVLLSNADLISGKTGAFDLTTGISGSFTDKLLISGVEVLTGFNFPGGGEVIQSDEENVNFGVTDEEDNRAVNFQQGGETKLEINENGEVVIKGGVFTTEATTTSLFEGPVTNNSFTNLLGVTNLSGPTNIAGATQIVAPTFDIGEDVVTTISGSTFLEGATTIKNSLTVAADQATSLGGTLDVGKATTLGGSLTVADGQDTTLGGDTTVKGDITSERLILKKDSEFTSIIAPGDITENETYILPGVGGTIALTSDIVDNPEDGDTLKAISSNWAFNNVKTPVPENAVFTDTTYSVEDGGLTQKNFTDDLKNKLDSIDDNAEVNVQADWGENSNTSDAFIRNKPTSLPPASHSLSSHSDVSDEAPGDGQVLTWDAIDNQWVPVSNSAFSLNGTTLTMTSNGAGTATFTVDGTTLNITTS